MENPKFIDFFVQEENIVTAQDKEITVLHVNIADDEEILNQWAEYLRDNYCSLADLDMQRNGFGISRKDFLLNMKFPDPTDRLGPSTMSGDFSEILIASYIEYVLNYVVPKVRYKQKFNRNTSTQGSDLIGYKLNTVGQTNKKDEMIVIEVKARNSESAPDNVLQNAVNHSAKDLTRIGESLNASYQMLNYYGNSDQANLVKRFQNSVDRPYKRIFAAAAVCSDKAFSRDLLKTVDISTHPDKDVQLIAVHSPKFLEFIKQMYVRAANVN